MIKHFDAKEKSFEHLGGVLSCLTAKVTEKGNGSFELQISCDTEAAKALKAFDVLTAPSPRGEQPFRIYSIKKMLDKVEVKARHISYDLAGYFIEDGRPTDTTAAGAFSHLKTKCTPACPFNLVSDLPKLATSYFVRSTMLEAVLGKGGLCERWGGYLRRDGYKLELLAQAQDKGVKLALGRDVLGVSEFMDSSAMVTALMPTWAGEERGQVESLPEKIIHSPQAGAYPLQTVREYKVKLPKDRDERKALSRAQIESMAREQAAKELERLGKPLINYKIDVLDLSKTDQYKDVEQLQALDIWDAVHLDVESLGIEVKAAVISYEFDAIEERITKIEIGNAKPASSKSSSRAIQAIQEAEAEQSAFVKQVSQAQEAMEAKITGAHGGSILTRFDEEGRPYEMLILDTLDTKTAKNVSRWNHAGLAFSKNGINGPYDIAMTPQDGLYAKHIHGLKITAAMIEAGAITADKLAVGSVSAEKLAAGAITADKLTAGRIQSRDGRSFFDLDTALIYTERGHFTGDITASNIMASTNSAGSYYGTGYHMDKEGKVNTGSQNAYNFNYQSGHIAQGVTIGQDLHVSTSGMRLQVGGNVAVFENTGNAWLGIWAGNPDMPQNALWWVTTSGQASGSDRKLKKDIRKIDLEEALEFLRSFDLYDFTLKSTGERGHGVIANFFKFNKHPWAKQVINNNKGILGVDYTKLNTMALGAVKALDLKVKDLEDRLSKLEAKQEE